MYRHKTVYDAKIGESYYQFICEPTEPVDNVIAVLEKMLSDARSIKEEALEKYAASRNEAEIVEATIEE